MSGELSPRTLVYARHIGRELALLSLSALSQFSDDELATQVSLADILERSVRVLISEAEEYITHSGKTLEESHEALDQIDPEDSFAKVENTRDLQQHKRKLTIELEACKTAMLTQIQILSHTVNILGEALHMPLMRILADNPDIKKFTLELVSCWRSHHQEIDDLINQVSEEWTVDRMNSLDRDLIRIGATEMLFDPVAKLLHGNKTPLPVIINEAVELAKKYGTDESYRFVNAILRNLLPHAEESRRNA